MRARVAVFGVLMLVAGAFVTVASTGTAGAVPVANAADFATAWELGTTTSIELLDDITLVGTAPTRPLGASDIIIEGNGHTLTAAPNDRVVNFFNPSGNGIWRNITVTGGLAGGGNSSGIGQGGNLTLENVDVFNNVGSNLGAGVYAIGDIVITNSRIHDNSTGGDGPGVYAQGGTITVTSSTIGPNNVSTGGGDGGGLFSDDDITITDSSVIGNAAEDGGGISGADVTLIRSTVSGNEAEFDGGGVDAGGDTTATNSTVSNNTAGSGGGGIHGQTAHLIYSDIVSNSAPSGANLDSTDTDILTSFGTVIADPQGGGTSCSGFDPTTATQGYNYESGGASCGFGAGPGDVSDGPDPQLGALAANGGPTQTRLPAATSPLLNKIPAAACGGPNADITTDQRGIARPQQGACDIGAVEVLEAIELVPTFTG